MNCLVKSDGTIRIGTQHYHKSPLHSDDPRLPVGKCVLVVKADHSETLLALHGDGFNLTTRLIDYSFPLSENAWQSHTCGDCDLCTPCGNDRGLCHRAEPYRYNEVWLIYPIVHLKCPACSAWIPKGSDDAR